MQRAGAQDRVSMGDKPVGLPLPKHIFEVDQRRVERDAIRVATRIRRKAPPHGPPEDATLLNISRYGFMAHSEMQIADGSLIAIELPHIGEVKARAIWSMDENIGGEFLAAIDPYSYFDMLARINTGKRDAA